MESEALEIDRRDAVTVLHIDDGKVNALTFELIAAMIQAVEDADADDSVGAVVIHGREGRFSAGFDLEVMMGGDIADAIRLVSDGGDLVRTLYGCGIPVVAACTGHALAAGALVLLGCDVRIGADVPAKVGLNEVAIKMVLPDWAMTIAAARLSKRHVQRAVVNARITAPADAVDVGFLDEVVESDALFETAVARAAELAATLDPAAYRNTVRKFRGPVLDTMATQIAADRAAGRSVLA
jgi:enoyl-CoA hydratase